MKHNSGGTPLGFCMTTLLFFSVSSELPDKFSVRYQRML